MRWKRSKISAAARPWSTAPHRASSAGPGGPRSHLGRPISGRRVRKVQAPVKARKSPTGSASKTDSSTTTSAPSDSSTPTAPLAGGRHLGVHGGVAERRGVGDADRDVGVVERRQPRGLGAGEGAQVGGVRPDGHIEGAGDVGHAPGHGAVGRQVHPSGGSGRRRGPGRGSASCPRGRSRPRGSGWSGRRRIRWRGGPCPPPARPPHRPRTRPALDGSNGFSEGPKMVLVVFPIQPNSVCWSCRPRHIRPPACGRRRGRRGGGRVVGVQRRAVGGRVADRALEVLDPEGYPGQGPGRHPRRSVHRRRRPHPGRARRRRRRRRS